MVGCGNDCCCSKPGERNSQRDWSPPTSPFEGESRNKNEKKVAKSLGEEYL